MKLSLRALYSTDRFTFGKTYPVCDSNPDGNPCLGYENGYWVKNDKGNYSLIAHPRVKRGNKMTRDDGRAFCFELVMAVDQQAVKSSVNYLDCLQGGSIYGIVSGSSDRNPVNINNAVNDFKVSEHDKALSEMDKYLPAYRNSSKGFQLSDSVEWLCKVNLAHEKDCIKYEAIIENFMEAFDIMTHDDLAALANTLAKSKRIITEVKNNK